MNRSILFAVALAIAPMSCGGAPPSPATVAEFVDAGCNLVAVASPNGPAATYCKTLEPIVLPIIDKLIARIVPAPADRAAMPSRGELKRGGKVIGYARKDLLVDDGRTFCAALQAELDAAK